MLRFVNSVDGPRLAALGTSCPDHFLRTKIKPLFVDWDPETGDVEALQAVDLPTALAQYRKDYAAYYDRCKRPDSPAMRDPNPTVVLIPGLGMIAWGKNKSESRVTAEFYNCAIEVMRGAEAIDQYEAMDQQEAFDIEYWPLEEAKLRRLPPEKELDRQIVVVIGAGAGIGKSDRAPARERRRAHGLRRRRRAAAKATAARDHREIRRGHRRRRNRHQQLRPRDRPRLRHHQPRVRVAECSADVLLAYGGLDAVVVTAGIFVPPDKSGPRRRCTVGEDVRDQRDRRVHRR